MTTFFKSLPVLFLAVFFLTPALVHAQDNPAPPGSDPNAQGSDGQDTSFQTFYDQLGDQGTWVQTDDYGYVWQPPVSDPDWRPYSQGHWVYTDAGWTWVSDEPWGWATYHYGRWANIDGRGWVWVPGNRWAPAWVSWRYGGGYVGWAPLPPETLAGADFGGPEVDIGLFHFGGDVDVSFGIGAGFYNFVPIDLIGAPNVGPVIVNHYKNYGIINHTTNITNLNVNRSGVNTPGGPNHFGSVAAGGPPINAINAHARQPIPTVQLNAANRPGANTQQGNSLSVFAPRVNPASAQQSHPANVAQTLSHPTFNRGNSVTNPLGVTASIQPPAPSAEAIRAAQEAQQHAPAHAKIATENAPVKTFAPTGTTVTNPPVEHHPAEAPFTGEPVHPNVTQPHTVQPEPTPQVTHTQNVQPGNTGGSQPPSQAQQQQAQAQAAQQQARQQAAKQKAAQEIAQQQAAEQQAQQQQAQPQPQGSQPPGSNGQSNNKNHHQPGQ